jgi:hypothetical protein
MNAQLELQKFIFEAKVSYFVHQLRNSTKKFSAAAGKKTAQLILTTGMPRRDFWPALKVNGAPKFAQKLAYLLICSLFNRETTSSLFVPPRSP